MANEVGDRRIAQHASAIGQRRANEAQHLSVGEIDVDRRGIAGPDHFGALGDERAQFVLGQLPGAGVAAVIHQRDEGRLAVGLLVGQREIIAEGAVDEFGARIGIEQHDADVDLIECGRQAVGGGMMLLLPCERIDPFLPQQAGDERGAAGGRRQQQHARQVRHVVTGRGTVVEEEQRGRRHRNDGAGHAGDDAADGSGQSDDADEQRCGIGDGNDMPVDEEGEQRRRCRKSRTGDCAPV